LDLFNPDPNKAKKFRVDFPEIGDSPFALYAGTFGIINGVSYLVDVAEHLRSINSEVKIVAIGHGFEWDKVKNLAESKGVLNDNFFIYSSIPKNELINAFSAATFGFSLFIDLKEMESNSANKFFDTLASATPILINYGGWQAEILNEHRGGTQISRDPLIAALFIDEKSKDKNYLTETSIAARELAENMFSRDILAERLEATLIEALNSK
jgi:glycosyltransferase involved in cell wall biosynthesis